MLYSYEQCKILLNDFESYSTLQNPLLINWNINGKCQNKCIYCFSKDYTSISDLLSESKLDHIIACIKSLNPLVVVLSGGEPLLYPKIKYIIENLKKFSGVILDTNGLCLNEDFIMYSKKNKILLRISLDDYRSSINDNIRKSNVSNSTNIILDIIENLLITNTNFIVHTVLLNDNMDNILEFGKYLVSKGIKFWEIQVVIPYIGDREKLYNKISELKIFAQNVENRMNIKIHTNNEKEKGIILINPKGEFLTRKANSLKKEFIDFENKDNPDLSSLMNVLDIQNHFERYTGENYLITKGDVMIDLNDGGLIIGIIASILATIIGSICTIIFTKIKNRKKAKLYKRIKEASLINFFYNRSVLNSDSGSVGNDIRRAEKEVYLIGSWLTSSNNEDFRKAICEKAEAGVEFYFCFNNLDYNTIDTYAKFINSNLEDIVQSLYNTYARIFEIKKSLSAESKNKIHISSHDQMLITAFWGFDTNHEKIKKRRYKLDHKLVKGEISHSYGLEFCYTKKCEFASNIRDAYMFVIDNAKSLNSINDLLIESSQINEKNKHDIIVKNFK